MYKNMTALLLSGVATLFLACGDDSGKGDADAGEKDSGPEAFVCDPKGANPEMGDLMNAPLGNEVEVIEKEAQHPGDPGPLNLP